MEELTSYQITLDTLKKGKILARGTLTSSNIPKEMPIVDNKHTLVGVLDDTGLLFAVDIKTKENYTCFLRAFGTGSFLFGGEYILYSLPA